MPIDTTRATPITVPQCDAGLGALITTPDAGQLIRGVVVADTTVWPDDRGVFFEVARIGQGLISRFDPGTTQVSATFTYPGAIKAFHYHVHQWDCWVPLSGMFQVALVDLRADSPTFRAKNTLYVGEHRPWQILIPPGVAHGYKVIGDRRAGLVYVTSRFYDPDDEGRIPYNDPRLSYDWETQHR